MVERVIRCPLGLLDSTEKIQMPVKNLFLSVGAMKAGTTFLYNTLSRHPQIFCTPEKELHYFAHTQEFSRKLQKPLMPSGIGFPTIQKGSILTHNLRRSRLSAVMHNRYSKLTDAEEVRNIVRWYADRYLVDPIDPNWFDSVYEGAGDNWCAEFSNYNAQLNDKSWANIRTHCENLRVLYVLRDPVKRLWSHIKFEMLLSGKRDALVSSNIDIARKFLASGSSSHARYTEVVNSLKRNLSESELLVLRLEDVVENPVSELRRITEFMGIAEIDVSGVNTRRKANSTEDLPLPVEFRELFETAVRPEIEFFNKF